ncbi:MAG TPA: ATP phosphoribosyltransferase [Bacteroidales bacterium]|nr:ATP phosphoribosyltransferase [Bacteroidales bacterium]
MLKIAVQKSGRLNEGSLALLKDCGIIVENGGEKLKAEATGFPLEVIFLRNSDIPEYVQDGVVHCGIIGENVLVESKAKVEVLQKLGFSRCRLSLAIPKEAEYTGLGWFDGKQIATSYPNSLRAFLAEHKLSAEIHLINGSVEIAPALGLADAVCDLVSSGNTLFSNGLREVEVMLRSEAVLVASNTLSVDERQLLEKLLFRIRAVLNARHYSYVLLNCPEEKLDNIIKILPGMKSPTIMPLAQKGWVSLHSVVHENDFWNHIDALKHNGAEGILIIPIEKMIY